MAAAVLLYFLYFLMAQLALYLVGHFVLRLFQYESAGFFSSYFDKSLAGLVVCVFLFSVFVSSVKTIQWGILLVAIFMWYEFRVLKKEKLQATNVFSVARPGGIFAAFLPIFLLALLVYGWFAWHAFNWHSDFMYAMPHKDKVYYTNISTALTQFGYENRQGAYYPIVTETITEPYHYFDLWLTSMLSLFTGKPAVIIVSLLSLPICALIAMAGILSIFEDKGPLKSWHYVMAFLLLFIRGIYLERHDPQIAWAENFSEGITEFKSEKLGVLYIFGIFSFRLLLKNRLLPALVSFLVFPIVSIGNFPGVAGGLILFLFVAWLSKMINRKAALRMLIYSSVVSVFIYFFYRLTGDSKSNPYLQKGLFVFTDLDTINFYSIKVAIAELFVRVMNNPWRAALIHLPFLLIACIVARNNREYGRAFLLVGCIYFVSLAVYGFFYKLVDAPQFYTNNLPLLNIFLIFGSALFLVHHFANRTLHRAVSVSLIGILCVMMLFSVLAYRDGKSYTELYSDKYLCAIDSVHRQVAEKSGVAVLYNPSHQPDLYNCDMSGPNLLYLPFFPEFRVPVDLNIFADRTLTWGGEMGVVQKRFIEKAPFRRFVLQQMAAGTFNDIATSQVQYIGKENIRYLFVSRGIEPDHKIVALVRKRIKDERSGEQLLILNPIPSEH